MLPAGNGHRLSASVCFVFVFYLCLPRHLLTPMLVFPLPVFSHRLTVGYISLPLVIMLHTCFQFTPSSSFFIQTLNLTLDPGRFYCCTRIANACVPQNPKLYTLPTFNPYILLLCRGNYNIRVLSGSDCGRCFNN